jgi:hypothetical protein
MREGKTMNIAARQRYALTVAVLALALAACAGGASSMNLDFNSYAHKVTDGTVALYWNCSRPAPGLVRVAGVANNPYSPTPLEDLEFRLYGVNATGRNISRARADAKAYMIQTNAPSPFTIDLKPKGGEARFDLVYSYMLAGGIGGGRAFGMGAEGGGEQQNMAQNVCAGLAP